MSDSMKGNKVTLTRDQVVAQFDRQIKFLRNSCAAYDAGDHDEAALIAVRLRVLLQDTRNQKSLFTQLGIKDTISYVDTGVYRKPFNDAVQALIQETESGSVFVADSPTHVGLVEAGEVGDGRVGWFAPLRLERFMPGSPPWKAMRRVTSFEPWWRDELVESSSGKAFSRRDLVLIMAEQDGGAHVDPSINADYADLCVDPLMQAVAGNFTASPDVAIPDVLHNVAYASVRQIAFEVITTLARRAFAEANPHIFAFKEPYASMPMAPPPHRGISIPMPLILTRSNET